MKEGSLWVKRSEESRVMLLQHSLLAEKGTLILPFKRFPSSTPPWSRWLFLALVCQCVIYLIHFDIIFSIKKNQRKQNHENIFAMQDRFTVLLHFSLKYFLITLGVLWSCDLIDTVCISNNTEQPAVRCWIIKNIFYFFGRKMCFVFGLDNVRAMTF